MTDQWVVVLDTGTTRCVPYGPIDDEETAKSFAEFLTSEVDPAGWHRLLSPTAELLSFWRNHAVVEADVYPEDWPPKPGQVWQDRDGNRWACAGTPPRMNSYMFCLAHPGDDPAEEIWRRFGPLHLVMSISPTEEEAPF